MSVQPHGCGERDEAEREGAERSLYLSTDSSFNVHIVAGKSTYNVGEKYKYLDPASQKKIEHKTTAAESTTKSFVDFPEGSYWDYGGYDYNLNKENIEIKLTNSSGEARQYSLPLYHRELGPRFALRSDTIGNIYAIYGIHLNPAYYKSSIKEYNVHRR